MKKKAAWVFLRATPIRRYVTERQISTWLRKRMTLRYSQLYEVIKTKKIETILEIGTHTGFNAYHMIRLCKKNSKKVSYYGFDLFEDLTEEILDQEKSKRPYSEKSALDLLRLTGANIYLFKGNTKATLRQHLRQLPKMDFIFIDGGHSLETIKNDWFYVQKVLTNNSLVIFDDYWENNSAAGCKRLVDNMDREKYNVRILPKQDVFQKGKHFLKINLVLVTLN